MLCKHNALALCMALFFSLYLIVRKRCSVSFYQQVYGVKNEPSDQSQPLTRLKQIWEPSSDGRTGGGVLLHMMAWSDALLMATSSPFILDSSNAVICDCSEVSPDQPHTCSAWSFLRSDLMPSVYNQPYSNQGNVLTPLVGIILDASKAWDLITSMGVVDSNTWNRSCCRTK